MLTESMLGYRVRSDGLHSCLSDIKHAIDLEGPGKWLACINPHSYVVALDRPEFSAALHAADWLIPDGSGVMLASRILGVNIRQRITGPDVFYGLHDLLQGQGGYSVFFLGSSDDTLATIRERMARDWPQIDIAGSYSPPFKASFSPAEIDQMVERVNRANADVLWVGMTAPKQEEWIHQVLPRLNVRFAGAVGAIFDFYAGKVKRSHPFFGRLGLEWLPRLLREPRRLWRRTLVSAPIFLWHVLRARFGATATFRQ
ncbi:MAG: WecB/TagA/CpsF family glycosyltransferase [Gammaproteobacteria bacterium]|jgi:N-acetylglucosaminyldiphosphoundecaprenol N-acetyl-beta-D-mannosaminyltransferase